MPYSVCGCVPDADNSGHRISRLVSKVLHKDAAPRTIDNCRPDLISTANEDADASHPSEHNVDVGDPSGKASKRAVVTREVKAERRYHGAEKASGNPTHDPWVSLQAERNPRRTKRDGHKEAFTDPYVGAGAYYPYWGISTFPAFG